MLELYLPSGKSNDYHIYYIFMFLLGRCTFKHLFQIGESYSDIVSGN